MADIGTEAEQRRQFITETEHRIAETGTGQEERTRYRWNEIQRSQRDAEQLGRTSALDRGDTRGIGTEGPAYRGDWGRSSTESQTLTREIKQREQSKNIQALRTT